MCTRSSAISRNTASRRRRSILSPTGRHTGDRREGVEVFHEITVREVPASPTAVIAQATTWDEYPRLWPVLLDEVYAFVRAGGASQAGHNVMLYRDDVPNVEVGVQVDGPFAASGSCDPVGAACGPSRDDVHRGDYSGLEAAHVAIRAWCAAREHMLTRHAVGDLRRLARGSRAARDRDQLPSRRLTGAVVSGGGGRGSRRPARTWRPGARRRRRVRRLLRRAPRSRARARPPGLPGRS